MKAKNIFKIAAAILIGEIALIILATVAQEVLFDGIRYAISSKFDLIFGGLATFMAAVGAGLVAGLIIRKKVYAVPIGLSIIITAEMTYLITSGKTGDPAWFDALGGSSLIIGVWLGFLTYNKFFNNKNQLTAQA